MVVPAHSQFKLYSQKRTIDLFPKAEFILAEDLTLDVGSTFKNLYSTPDNAIMDLMGMVSVLGDDFVKNNPQAEGFTKILRGVATIAKGASGKYREFGFQVYQSNDPLQLRLNLELRATYNALIQVYTPVKTLMLQPIPTTGNEKVQYNEDDLVLTKAVGDEFEVAKNKEKNNNGNKTLFSALSIPGPSLNTIVKELAGDESEDNSGRIFCCSIGNMFFDDVFIERVTPTFSQDKMKVGDVFYPMSCKLSLILRGMFIMTKGTIINMTETKETNQNTKDTQEAAQPTQGAK